MNTHYALYSAYGLLFLCIFSAVYSLTSIVRNQYSSYEERTIKNSEKKNIGIFILIDPDKFYHLSLAIACLFFLVGFALFSDSIVNAICFGTVLAGIGFITPRLYLSQKLIQRIEKIGDQLPESLDRLSSSMKAGLTLPQAIEKNMKSLPLPIKDEFGIMFQESRLGLGVVSTLKNWERRMNLEDLSSFVAAVDISFRAGGNMTEIIDSTSKLIKDRNLFAKEVRTLTSEGRSQAMIVSIAPIVMFLYSGYNDSGVFSFFLTTEMGKLLIISVIVLQVIAYFWIKKIMDIEY